MKSKSQSLFFIGMLLINSNLHSQDYPYDDVELKPPPGALPREENTQVTGPGERKSGRVTNLPALRRFSLRAGSNFSFISADDTNTTGFGVDALLGFQWDLPYQPVAFELASGYQVRFLSTDFPLHVIPIRIGMARRFRLGPRSVLKLGIVPAFEFQIVSVNGTSGSDMAFKTQIGPMLRLEYRSSVWEIDFMLDELQEGRSVGGLALRIGFLF